MKPTVFIPKKIKAGYQSRAETFTGKLAYVIYYDERNKLRKEKSWNRWRQEGLGSDDFENIPLKGFTINKKVGGYKSRWNFRKSYIRIYDPRGFEFEITVENLVYILENVISNPETGLEGEFIYGWDGADLVLIPVNSEDYKEIKEYNKLLHDKKSRLKVKDLTVGGTYKHKNNGNYVYMGRRKVWEDNYEWQDKGSDSYGERTILKGKYHTFIRQYKGRDARSDFFSIVNVKSPSGVFIQEVSNNKSEELEAIEKYISESYKFNPIDEELTELIKLDKEGLEEQISNGRPLLINNNWYVARGVPYRIAMPINGERTYKLYEKMPEKDEAFKTYERSDLKVIGEGITSELIKSHEIYMKKFFLEGGTPLNMYK